MEIEEIAKKLIEEYKGVFERLKQYDEGKIDINTDKLCHHIEQATTKGSPRK